jgi:hypothetical protein
MKAREWTFIWVAGVLACAALILVLRVEPQGQEPAGREVVITGVYSAELYTSEMVYYVNFLVDAVPATHDFKNEYETLAFVKLLETKYNASWMHKGELDESGTD